MEKNDGHSYTHNDGWHQIMIMMKKKSNSC